MSETITEMVLPGTYIEVRAEGLIGVSGIATGNLGVVGTAARGPVNEVVLLGSYAEAVDAFGPYDAWSTAAGAHPLSLTRTIEQLFRGGASTVYAVRIAGSGLAATKWDLTDAGTTPAKVVFLEAKTPGTWAENIVVSLSVDSTSGAQTLTLELGKQKETFTGDNAGEIFDAVNAGSALVKVVDLKQTDRTKTLKASNPVPIAVHGANGEAAGGSAADTGLKLLASQPVNILVVGGLSVADVSAQVLGHLEDTENDGRERIAVLGTRSADLAEIASDSALVGNPRVVLVAPGIFAADAASPGGGNVNLPPSYAAALVAAKMSTLASQVSLTNKDVAAAGLTRIYTRAEQKQLLGERILVLRQNLGFRILKGISTDPGAFGQITTRRIIDEGKEAARRSASSYIGKLNNARVRDALRATLAGSLNDMVVAEKLIGYDLAVTATREQEIAGKALVTMTLQPTFSIDFIQIIMNLS
ncbi:MAG TPA: phage tail sheath C-terminal domain-containing protein [Thermoanaerobaculia bacterium]|jgi:hypothetical protein|nr:phage tail sheath C-terminal domain-containing protein [Thermoanaerobaculia bacterium]